MFDLGGSFRGHSQVFSFVIPDFCWLAAAICASAVHIFTKADGLHLGSMGVSVSRSHGGCEMTGSGTIQVWPQVLGGSDQ